MDGRVVVVNGQPGDVVKPGDKKVVVGEGMPIKGNPQERGNLIITFNILFPEPHQLHASAAEVLQKVLPQPEPFALPADTPADKVYESTVIDYIPAHSASRGGGEAYDSDEDVHHAHGRRAGAAQCQFQ